MLIITSILQIYPCHLLWLCYSLFSNFQCPFSCPYLFLYRIEERKQWQYLVEIVIKGIIIAISPGLCFGVAIYHWQQVFSGLCPRRAPNWQVSAKWLCDFTRLLSGHKLLTMFNPVAALNLNAESVLCIYQWPKY